MMGRMTMVYMYILFYGMAFIDRGTPARGTTTYRLMDGMYESEGRVEVISTGFPLASICDSLWGIEDATVICKYLNYTGADLALLSGYFGDAGNASAYDELTCTGLEDHLLQCSYSDVGSECPHSEKGAGVTCTAQGSLRLANGSVPGEGRVEILGESGDWGTICDDRWDKTDAGVACRQLGYPDALEAIVNVGYPNTQPVFGSGSGPILLDGLSCVGNERHLRDCQVTKGWGVHDCTHGEDAGVICDTKLIRLEGGQYSNQGRVEVYHGGTWGSICSSPSWNIKAAHVACKELGFSLGALEAISLDLGPFTVGEERRVLLDEVNCFGNESRVGDCESLGWAKVQSCTSYPHHNQIQRAAGVTCNDPTNVVRLLSGSSSYEGVVQYRNRSEAGLICDPDWSDKEANVTCRQLGYQYGRSEKPVSLGPLSGTIFYLDYHCNGTEQHLGDCHFSLFLAEECDPINHIAQVLCGPPKEFDLRLRGSDYTEQGRVEVYFDNEWSSITDNFFTYYERDTACQQLGYEGTFHHYNTYSLFERGTARIVIDDLECYSFHYKITDCIITFTGNTSANTHDDELEVVCVPHVSVANHPIRLINEKGQINREYGRVEIFHDGIWGSVCYDYFRDAELICRELGYNDVTYVRRLLIESYSFSDPSWVWFRLESCNDLFSMRNIQHLFECRFTSWGNIDQCYNNHFIGVQCIDSVPTLTEATLSNASPTQDPARTRLNQWEVFLIAVAFILPLVCVVGCCYHRHRSKSTNTPSNVNYTSTNNGSVSVIVTSPPPPYVPSSPSPTELPPSYDSVIQPTNQTDQPADDNVTRPEDMTTSDANSSMHSSLTTINVSNVVDHSDARPMNLTEDNNTSDIDNHSETITPKNTHNVDDVTLASNEAHV